jgi:hypothetical protein
MKNLAAACVVSIGIVAGAALHGWVTTPKYQLAAFGGVIYRMDVRTGETISTRAGTCSELRNCQGTLELDPAEDVVRWRNLD